MRRPPRRALVLLALALVALVAASAKAQEPGIDEAHLRRAIDRDPARAVTELNALVRRNPEPAKKPLLLLLRAVALAQLGEKRDALEDACAVLSQPRDERLEVEAASLVRALRGVEVELRAPRGARLPATTTVAIVGSARGTLEVDWAVYRLDEHRLREALSRRPDLEGLLRRPPPEALARVDAGHFAVEARGAFERAVEVGATRAPGLYVFAAKVADVPLRATLEVARHAVAARVTASGVLLWTFDATSGESREGARLDLLVPGELAALGVTGTPGLVETEASRGRVLAWSEGTLATLSLDGVARPASAATPLDLLVDRPLVRPGESVRALVVSAVVSSSHEVVLRDARGEALAVRGVTLDAHGVGAVDFAIPRVARSGAWTLEAPGGRARFEVAERAEPAAFQVELPDVKPLLAAGEPFLAHVRARGLAGSRASWRIRPHGQAAPLAAAEGVLDEDGELKVAARELPAGELVLEASVEDANGRSVREAVLLHVVPSRLRVTLDAEPPRILRAREGLVLRLTFEDLAGERARDISVVASATLGGREVLHLEQRLESNVVSIRVPLETPGVATVGVVATNKLGRLVLSREVLVVGDELPREPALTVRLDREQLKAGERARVFARFPHEKGHALVTKERGGVRARSIEAFERGTLVVEVPVDEGDAPGVDVVVASVHSGVLHAARAPLRVVSPRPLAVGLTVARSEPLAVDLRATTLGKPDRAELVVRAADARPFDLLRATAGAHGPRTPAPGVFSSELVRVADGGAAASGSSDDAGAEDAALVARARALDLGPDLAAVATSDETGSASVELPIAGPIRIGVLAASEGRFARAEHAVLVTAPLAVATRVPSRLVEGDEGELVASVTNALDEPQDVKAAWTARGFILRGPPRLSGARPAAGHEPEADSLWIALPPRARAELRFTAKAPSPGVAQLEVVALGDKLRAQAIGEAVVQGRSVPRSRTDTGVLGAAPVLLDPSVPDAAHPQGVKGELVIAPGPAAAAYDALDALEAADELDVDSLAARGLLAFAGRGPAVPGEPAASSVLLSLVELQRPDGSWPSSATACALEAIAAAPSAGLTLDAAIARGVAAARRELATAPLAERADLALALAVARAAPRDELALLLARRAELDPAARFALARAFLAAGDPGRARELVPGARPATTDGLAQELIVLARLGDDEPRRLALATDLLARRDGLAWPTARETALAARALLELAASTPLAAATRLDVTILGARAPLLKRSTTGARVERSLRIPLDHRVLAGARGIEVAQKGGALATYVLHLRWTKLTQGLKPLERGVTVKRSVDARSVARGSEVRVTLAVDSHAREPIVIDEALPAGATFLGEVGASGFEVERREGGLFLRAPVGAVARTFTYALRAERPGDWRALPARARVAKQPSVAGESDEWLLRVKD